MATSMSPPAFLRCKCVATRLNQRALGYNTKERKISISRLKTENISVLTDGATVFLNKKEGFTAEFEEGCTYILQKFNTSNTFGQMYLYVGPGTLKFKSVPLDITEEVEERAKHALCPPSPIMTGEEVDIFSKGGYLSLQGHIKEVQGVRMTRTNVPIVDAQLQCGQKTFDVSLWREVALTELYAGDEVCVTHLRPCILKNGGGKFHSSTYTSVKIAEGQVQEVEAEIIGVSEVSGTYHFLNSDMVVYVVPRRIVTGDQESLVDNLPLQVTIKHINRRVFEIETKK